MKYIVTIPIKGTISYEVDVPEEDLAADAAWAKYNEGVPWEDEEWETWESERLGFTVDVSKVSA